MISRLVSFVLSQRLMMLVLAVAIAAGGIWAYQELPIDAFPDISAPQVQVIVKAPGMSPAEVEQRITRQIEIEVQGIPRQTILRSLTKYALSIITIDFKEGTDIYWARQQVSERINRIWSELPAGVEGGLAPITTPLGEIYMFTVEGEGHSNRELRGILDWLIRPRLLTVEGVAEVNALGGLVRCFQVIPNPEILFSLNLNLHDIKEALEKNNRNAGGDRIVRNDEVLLVRTIGKLRGIDDINNITVTTRKGVPIHINDVAQVRLGAMTRYGGVTKNGQGEHVEGLVLKLKGANGLTTVKGIKEKIQEIQESLPQGVKIVPFYDRTDLVNQAITTVQEALGQAIILVIIVLLVFLGNFRSTVTVTLILPLTVLFTFLLMYYFDISANLMSLGGLAIAIGLLVDTGVVVVENIQTKLFITGHSLPPRDEESWLPPKKGGNPLRYFHGKMTDGLKGTDRLQVIYRAVMEVAPPIISGTIIIITVFLPLFSLSGLEGKMFTPLAITISFALVGSLLLALTVIPVIASFLMKETKSSSNNFLMDKLNILYRPIVDFSLKYRKTVIGLSLMGLLVAGWFYTRLGREFMPTMDEGNIVIMIDKLPSIALKRSLEIDGEIQAAMMSLPEVEGVVSRMGSDELRLDPMGLYQTDNFLLTRPRSEWTVEGPEELEGKLREILNKFPGIAYSFTQPIDMRASEMLTGVRAAVAVKLFGVKLELLEEKSREIEELIKKIPGSVDVVRTPLLGQQYLQVRMRPAAMSRYGVNAEDINGLISMAVGGQVITEVMEGSRKTAVTLRYPQTMRNSLEAIGNLLISTSVDRKRVPLSALATVEEVDGPVQIERESGIRQVSIQANVEGRDVVGFVEELRAAIEKDIPLPPGYFVTFGGEFQNQRRAAGRLAVVIPIALFLIFILLFSTFNSVRQAALIIMNIPFAMIGGVLALYLSGMYLSVPASVGFIALFGIAIMNGIVMVTYFNQLRETDIPLIEAIKEGTGRRLRPVLMTAITTALGLVPLLLATGPGSEIQKPLAVVVTGGLFTSTLLTLVVLPTLYAWIEGLAEKKLERLS